MFHIANTKICWKTKIHKELNNNVLPVIKLFICWLTYFMNKYTGIEQEQKELKLFVGI